VTTAWLTAMHEFPGRRFFEWALVLPLAMPAYVMAYVYTDFLQFVGPVQTACARPSAGSTATTGFPTSAPCRAPC
jgi:iron(III) transport system permease protein